MPVGNMATSQSPQVAITSRRAKTPASNPDRRRLCGHGHRHAVKVVMIESAAILTDMCYQTRRKLARGVPSVEV